MSHIKIAFCLAASIVAIGIMPMISVAKPISYQLPEETAAFGCAPRAGEAATKPEERASASTPRTAEHPAENPFRRCDPPVRRRARAPRGHKLGERTAILGVLNVTPDSFSDGGKYQDPDPPLRTRWRWRSRARTSSM